MQRTLAVLLFLSCGLGGCAELSTISQATTGSVASVIPKTMNDAKKVLTAAHDLHMGAADFLTIAATTNLCHAVCASTAKDYLDRSEAALVAADKLVVLGDAKGIEDKITSATALISASEALVNGNK